MAKGTGTMNILDGTGQACGITASIYDSQQTNLDPNKVMKGISNIEAGIDRLENQIAKLNRTLTLWEQRNHVNIPHDQIKTHTEELIIRIDKLIETRKLLQEKFSIQRSKKPNSNRFSSLDQAFLKKVNELIQAHIANESFSVETLAKEVFMSRSQLFRKFKSLIGKSPNIYIRERRLQHAMTLLKTQPMTLMQVASQVGFKDERYFSSKFKEYFGKYPSKV